jgi:hypothetical protein
MTRRARLSGMTMGLLVLGLVAGLSTGGPFLAEAGPLHALRGHFDTGWLDGPWAALSASRA